MASQQREYQKRLKAEGRCIKCGKPRDRYANHCDYHAEKSREQQRKRLGLKPGIGRPLVTVTGYEGLHPTALPLVNGK